MSALKQNVVPDKFKEYREMQMTLARYLLAEDKGSVHTELQARPKMR
jgi:hypothetical protein